MICLAVEQVAAHFRTERLEVCGTGAYLHTVWGPTRQTGNASDESSDIVSQKSANFAAVATLCRTTLPANRQRLIELVLQKGLVGRDLSSHLKQCHQANMFIMLPSRKQTATSTRVKLVN
jgi:guanyl-specific ribonuclease Sa